MGRRRDALSLAGFTLSCNSFCYAAKEHAEFETAGQLFFTYACNSTVESQVTNNMNLYHPVVVTQPLPNK